MYLFSDRKTFSSFYMQWGSLLNCVKCLILKWKENMIDVKTIKHGQCGLYHLTNEAAQADHINVKHKKQTLYTWEQYSPYLHDHESKCILKKGEDCYLPKRGQSIKGISWTINWRSRGDHYWAEIDVMNFNELLINGRGFFKHPSPSPFLPRCEETQTLTRLSHGRCGRTH